MESVKTKQNLFLLVPVQPHTLHLQKSQNYI